MTDAFDRRPLNTHAVDQAWADHIARRLSRFDAAMAMTLAGTTWPEAVALLRSPTLPSASGALAGVA